MIRDMDLQHPDITAAERTGYPYGYIEPPMAECRVCGCCMGYVTEEFICGDCKEVLCRYEGEGPA